MVAASWIQIHSSGDIMKSIFFLAALALSWLAAGESLAQTPIEREGESASAASALTSQLQELRLTRARSSDIDLRNLPDAPPRRRERPEREPPEIEHVLVPGTFVSPRAPTPPVIAAPAPSPMSNFLGLDFNTWGSGRPPDTVGDVGPTYYIQAVNASVGIFRKSDSVRVAAFTLDTFMSQGNFGNLCDTDNFGDPVILYDSFEDRWFITDFAFQLDGGGNVVNPPGAYQCFAVSKTNDPVAGGWNFYFLHLTDGLNDYGKFGIWPDGIYMAANMFAFPAGGGFLGTRVWALNKAQMYAGDASIQVVQFNPPGAEFTLLPANARLQAGTPPPGSPNYFSVIWQYTNAISVYKFHVDWERIALSSFTGPSLVFAPSSWASPPSTVAAMGGNANDTLGVRLMMQNQYANIGGVESLWNAHTVLGGAASTAAPRYYQVDVTAGAVAANTTQAFTHVPDTSVNRYMPSLAVDRNGDMAIGYSASSSALRPAIRYAGRLSSDPINSLPQTETSLVEGTGSQNTSNRWGDYSAMTLDPDGCTFWYTNEYYIATGGNWQTRVGSFAFPGCTPVSNGTLLGTVTASAGGAPISNVTVALGSRTTTTNASGVYGFIGLPSGTYSGMTVSKNGFLSASATNIAVSDGATTTRNFSLVAAPVNACLTDTTQADFQTGVPTVLDLMSNPGDVILESSAAIDQQNTNVTTSGFGMSSTSWVAQTFTAGATGQATQVDVNLFCSSCSGTTPNLTVSIRATTGATPLPTGADLATATIPGFNSNAGGYYSATFAAPATLTVGTRYAIVIRASANPSAGTYAYVTSSASPYANGQRATSTNSGSTWTADTTSGGRDLGFRVYMVTGYSPSGNLVSSRRDSNLPDGQSSLWTSFTWNAATPPNTSLRFQVAASNASSGPFTFVGPDGTAATYYTSSGGSLAQFNGNRYLKYRADLSTSNTAVTPTLNDVTMCYSTPIADVAISKTDGVSNATPGSSVVYTIIASNPSAVAATSATVVDVFPASLTCTWNCTTSGAGTCGSPSGIGNINDTINLPAGASSTYTASCFISASATGTLGNTATITLAGDPNPGNNTATDTDTLVPTSDLGITKSDGVTSATPGGSVNYIITASNFGPSNVSGATVADTFPASETCTWTCAGTGGGTCTASGSGNINNSVNLPSGGSVTYSASCAISPAATGTLSNTATVAAPGGVTDPNPGNNSATDSDTLNASADLSITKTDGVTVAAPGGLVTYTIVASNVGPSNASGATVADTFPGSEACTWTCAGAAGGTCTASGSGNINDTVNLPSGASTTYTASCTISTAATGSVSNTATVTAPGGVTDSIPGNNSAIDTDTLETAADLELTITDNRNFVQVGDPLDYLIEVSNPLGPSSAIASVNDTLPAILSGGSWICTGSGGASCGSASGSGNTLADTATVPAGGKASYLYSTTLLAVDLDDQVANTATASLTNGTDPTPGNNSGTDTDVVVIFRDGFDPGVKSIAEIIGSGTSFVSAQLRVDTGLLNSLGIFPVSVATGQSADGETLFTLQLSRFGSDYAVRILTRDDLDQAERSTWQMVDMTERLLGFAWQSATVAASDGFIEVQGNAGSLMVSGRSEQGKLTRLQVRTDNNTPWLTLIAQ